MWCYGARREFGVPQPHPGFPGGVKIGSPSTTLPWCAALGVANIDPLPWSQDPMPILTRSAHVSCDADHFSAYGFLDFSILRPAAVIF